MPARQNAAARAKIFSFEFDPEIRSRLGDPDAAIRAAAVKQAARALGFDLVGIAEAEPLNHEAERYREWLAEGHHADLEYMQRNLDKRQDVKLVLPGARSVIVLGYNYYTAHTHSDSAATAKISRYAWGDDYHDVIPPKLRALGELLRSAHPSSNYRVYTDTGPLLEKQWARRAGIGWQGKHTNIINRTIGSWFFIATIISDLDFANDRPINDHCGTCTACVQACPTDAIHEPYKVDTGRCISYWTIETKPDRAIPDDIAKNLEGWMFGCDICQDVCPWNRFQQPSDETRFQPRAGETSLNLQAVTQLEQTEFSMRFRKSPLKRAKLAGLQRNARVVADWRPLNAIAADADGGAANLDAASAGGQVPQ